MLLNKLVYQRLSNAFDLKWFIGDCPIEDCPMLLIKAVY